MTSSLRALGEFGLIRRLTRHLRTDRSVIRGVGDDAAVLRVSPRRAWLLSMDMLVEGVHFRRSQATPYQIGWKAMACGVSDIAAMGGRPRFAAVSVGLPRRLALAEADGIYRGLTSAAGRFRVNLVGGDTVRAPQLVVDVAIIGEAQPGEIVLRSGARVGDRLLVTGRLGGSYASRKHLTFTPRLRESQYVVRHARPNAMMDLSDGLASDLWRIAEASRVALVVDEAKIPVARAAGTVWHALMDGEDYELLFALPPRRAAGLLQAKPHWLQVTDIGVVAGRGTNVQLLTKGGRLRVLRPEGFKHF